MRKSKIIIFLILGLSSNILFAQKWRDFVDIDELIQDLVQQDENTSYEELYESMYEYQRSPINLNTTISEELANVYILSKHQIRELIEHRERFGNFLSIYELQALPSFDLETIYKLLAFADIRERSQNVGTLPLLKRMATEENNSFIYRIESTLEDQRGYMPIDADGNRYSDGYFNKFLSRNNRADSTPYLGGALKHLIRYRINHRNDYAVGLTATKGQGEHFTWDPSTKRYGFDFYSMHFVKYNIGRVKALALGDYQLQFGQGLVMAGGFAIGKGSETINTLRRSNTGIRPYTSTIESGFLRGAATTIELNKRFDATVFASLNKIDGIVLDSSNFNQEQIDAANEEGVSLEFAELSNYLSSGQHRRESELAKKRLIFQQIGGGNVTYESKNKALKVGATFVHTTFGANFRKANQTYNNVDFSGRKNATYGINYSYNIQNFNFFGEIAQSSSGGKGMTNGVIAYLSSKVEFAMLHRHFDPNFHTFYSRAFSEYSRNINESGIYWGTKIKFNNKWLLSGYYDIFSSPFLRFQADAPSRGNEYLMQLNYSISRSVKIYARTKVETKWRNQSDNITPIDFITPSTRKQYILNLDYNTSKTVSMKTRVQWSSFQQSNAPTTGYAIIQDFNFKVNKWTISSRYALFDTDDFDNRQYTYEKDVLYAFSIPAYNGKGVRTYVLLRYKPSKKLDFWLKVGRYLYAFDPAEPTISSGLEAIEGNHRTTARFQMRIKF